MSVNISVSNKYYKNCQHIINIKNINYLWESIKDYYDCV